MILYVLNKEFCPGSALFVKPVKQPLVLLLSAQVRIINQQCIISLTQWTLISCLVNMIALDHICQHIFIGHFFTLFQKFLISSFCPYLRRRCDKHLKLRVRKNRSYLYHAHPLLHLWFLQDFSAHQEAFPLLLHTWKYLMSSCLLLLSL